jgi:DNA replication and repair protein RecF
MSHALRLHKLNLSRFRNYETLRLAPEGAPIVVLTGPNGAGKTNLLEAVSLLAPGKGLRGAEFSEIQERGATEPWAVAAEVETAQGVLLRLGTGLRPDGKGRVVRLNGRDMKSQNDLAAIVSCVWLTPQMDRLFADSAGGRRRFLDRLVYAYQPDHAFHVSRAERNMRERLKLLQVERETKRYADPAWLNALEAQMAADFTAIAAARVALVAALSAHLKRLEGLQSLFPVPALRIEGEVEGSLAGRSALSVEDRLRETLAAHRAIDAGANRTFSGTHRSDMIAAYELKNAPAAQCSTGEQKGMLISIALAHALMMKAEKGAAPLLLLDEVAAHLDAARRDQLFALLAETGGQAWLTGTEAGIFAELRRDGKFFHIEGGRAHHEARIVPEHVRGGRAFS